MSKSLDFLLLVYKLKREARRGWIQSGVKDCESVAEHQFGMGFLSLFLAGSDSSLDSTRMVKMALVHDLAEALIGDITPQDGISKEQKHEKELAAMHQMIDTLGPNHEIGQEILSLWQEYEAGESPVAQFVKQLDKLEMIIQALVYEREQKLDLTRFFESTKESFSNPTLAALAQDIFKRREQKAPQ